MRKLTSYAVVSLILGLVLLAMVGCSDNPNTAGKQTDEQTAAGEYSIEGKTLEEINGMEYSQWLEHWKETYGSEVSVSGNIPINELKSLSEKAASLHWKDFDQYAFEDIGSGVYIRKYEIEGEGQLVVRGKSLENPPEQITMVDAEGKEWVFNPESLSELLK
ncbi:hypothetical protein NSU18_09765 [Paenibacillus sp. FSL H8-0048]|uniref:hypothetical protein n=1 Tax=Paenibacillus sp. FSL H8-0048 TaxID=2954508 RepID=UPI0030F99CC4